MFGWPTTVNMYFVLWRRHRIIQFVPGPSPMVPLNLASFSSIDTTNWLQQSLAREVNDRASASLMSVNFQIAAVIFDISVAEW